jgi:amino acid adenylation domain-containing protein
MFNSSNSTLKSSTESVGYWQQKLAGSLPLMDLPTDKSRPSSITYETETHSIFLAERLVNSLNIISRDRAVELFVTLLAVFKVLIYRYVDRQDILIGAPISNETRSAIDLLVFRTDLSGNPTFGQVLDRTQQVVAEAYEHQNLSFDRLIEVLEIENSPSYHPLVQVMFSWEQSNADLQSLAGLTDRFKIDRTHSNSSSLDLALKLEQTETGIFGHFEYSTDLFAVETIERMAMHFQTLLESIVANPDQSIDELPLLTDPERQQLLVAWNQTQIDYPDLCIHQLFEAQVERTPDNIAIIFEDQQQLTYQELNSQANQLANYLQKLGVAPDVPVGIYLERSVAMVVGLLGILKAGGSYVPLDPSYPQDRLTYMLANSQVKVLIGSQQLVTGLPKSDTQVVYLDTDWSKIDRENSENLGSEVRLDHLGYTIYTSGSTGLPKGVAMTQRALCNLIAWQIAQPTANPRAKTLQFTPISFDVSFQEIFATCCAGGTLVLVTNEIRRDPFALLNLLDRARIERLFLPFVALQQLAEAAVNRQSFPQQLREVITAGEQLQITPAIRKFFGNMPDCSLHNHYGPSESHVVTSFTLTNPVENWSVLPPIGRPIANTQLYVLDSQMQPVPIGVAGELYIGGDCLARAYFQRPDLTAEKFIPNPFDLSQESQSGQGQRLYKTGDLVRYVHDGNIEYLGRIDNQVKIRGFRIELGEIETLLSEHPTIVQATVVAREDTPGHKQLVAYYVTTDPESLHPGDLNSQIDELRSFISQKVPSYMVPTFFVLLSALPMTPSGKVDRRALPAPNNIRQLDTRLVTSNDRLELQLTKMWEQVLKIQPIGIEDNFFDLGGHSLLAVKLIAKIEQVWNQKLPLATFLAAPTIAQFATVLRQGQASTTWSSLVPIESHGSKAPLFCIHPVGGNVLEYYPLAHYLGREQPIYGIQSQGLDGIQAPLTQIKAMAANYINEIQTVQPDGPYLLVGYSFGGLIAFEIAHQLESRGKKVNLLALIDTESPNLPNVRPSLFQILGIHLHNFKQLNLQDKIKYIKDRIVFRLIYQYKENSHKEFMLNTWAANLPPAYLKVLEANFQSGENYIGKFYAGKITLFRSSIQPITQALHPDLGWGDITSVVEIHHVQGYHSNLLKEPWIQAVAQQLKLCIDSASGRSAND